MPLPPIARWGATRNSARVITTAMACVIGAPRVRVWRALTDPAEIADWDAARIALVDPPDAYPAEGSTVRWRYKLGSVSLVLKETPQLVAAPERLALACAAGSLHFEQAYQLIEEPEDAAQAARTRVSLKLSARNQVHLIGADIDRFEVRRMLIERIDEALRSLQKWCEGESADQR